MATDPSRSELQERLEGLEARIAALESGRTPVPPSPRATEPLTSSSTAEPAAADDPFWALAALKSRHPSPGAVVFTGSVDVGLGHAEYQWERPTGALLAMDWAEHAETVAALGHPLRLAILRLLLDGERTVAQLVDDLELSSTGVAYHHLTALHAGGWVVSPRRGSWTLPAPRMVPLLTIIAALEKG